MRQPSAPHPPTYLRRTGRGRAHGGDAFVWSTGKEGSSGGSTAEGSSRGRGRKAAGGGLSFWPLPLELSGGEAVLLELRGDPAGVVSDLRIGTAQLSLEALVQQHPQLLGGEAVALHVPLRPGAAFGASPSTAAAVAAAAGEASFAGDGAAERDSNGEEEEEEAAADGQQQGGPPRGSGAAGGTAGGAAGGAAGGQAGRAAAATAPRVPSLPASAAGLPPLSSLDPCTSSASSTQLPPPQAAAAPGGAIGRTLASAALAVSGAAVKAVNMVVIPAAALFKSEAATELDAAASAASDFAAAAGGQPTLSLVVQLEPVSCLEAAIGAGLTPAAAQTCLAMLAEPGGLVSLVRSV